MLRLLAQERTPRQARTLSGRTDALLAQDLPDCRRRQLQAEPVDLAGDPLIPPARVLSRESEHQLTDLTADRRSSDPAGVRPAASHQPPMPTKKRRRSHDKAAPARAGQQPAHRPEHKPIARPQLRPAGLPAQYRQLMPQNHDLQLLEAIRLRP